MLHILFSATHCIIHGAHAHSRYLAYHVSKCSVYCTRSPVGEPIHYIPPFLNYFSCVIRGVSKCYNLEVVPAYGVNYNIHVLALVKIVIIHNCCYFLSAPLSLSDLCSIIRTTDNVLLTCKTHFVVSAP